MVGLSVTFALLRVVFLILDGINILQFLGHFHVGNYPLVRKKLSHGHFFSMLYLML